MNFIDVFARHDYSRCLCRYIMPGGFRLCGTLLDELAAATPRPSREALEKIMHEAAGGFSFHQELLERIWAWAAGMTERRWCKDIIWATGKEMPPLICGSEPRWVLLGATALSTDGWKVCPLCAAPRPQP